MAAQRRLQPRELMGIFVAAAVIRLGAELATGPRLGGDSPEFLAWAHSLGTNGVRALPLLRVEHAPVYGVFLAVGLLFPWLDLSWFAALSQTLLGSLTAVVVARLTVRETHSRMAGLCAGAISATEVSFVFWTAYVLSDTLFLLLVAVCADRALLLRKATHPGLSALGLGCLALLCVAARPTGVALCLALLPLVVIAAHRRTGRMAALVGGFCLPFLMVCVVVVLAGSSLASRVTDWARSGVENGLLWTEAGRATSGIDLDVYPPPVVNTLPSSQRDEFLQDGPLTFAAGHPEFVLEQFARKFRTFWAPALPEYSLAHTVAAGLYFGLFDVLALTGLVAARRFTPMTTLVVVGVAAFTLTSLITIVDYDLRYRLPAELLLTPVAGLGLAWVISRVGVRGAERPPPVESARRRVMPS